MSATGVTIGMSQPSVQALPPVFSFFFFLCIRLAGESVSLPPLFFFFFFFSLLEALGNCVADEPFCIAWGKVLVHLPLFFFPLLILEVKNELE